MPRDIEELTAQFSAADDAGKIDLFRVVVDETIVEFQNGALTEATIEELLAIFNSIVRSPEIITIAQNARTSLSNLQYDNDVFYSAQIEPINELLDFLRPYQPPAYEDRFDFEHLDLPSASIPMAIVHHRSNQTSGEEGWNMYERMQVISKNANNEYYAGRMAYSYNPGPQSPLYDSSDDGIM